MPSSYYHLSIIKVLSLSALLTLTGHANPPLLSANGMESAGSGADAVATPGAFIELVNQTPALPGPYQWFRDGRPIEGATDPHGLQLPDIQPEQAGYYLLRDSMGTLSRPFPLSVVADVAGAPAPRIALGEYSGSLFPVSLSRGERVVLSASLEAGGESPLEWVSADLHALSPGHTTTRLEYPSLQTADLGFVGLRVTRPDGVILASPFHLEPSSNPHLTNLSGRAWAGGGDDAPTAGFVVDNVGPVAPENLWIRGVGPGLVPFGVTRALVDPALTLTRYGENSANAPTYADDWTDDEDTRAEMALMGAFPLPPGSKDAVLRWSVDSTKPVTVRLDSRDGTEGVGLLEIYDRGNSHPFHDYSHFANVSFRARAGHGDATLVGGFVVWDANGFNRPVTVLIRAIGPRLADFGIQDFLSDPALRLYGSDRATLAFNDNWNDQPDSGGIALIAGNLGAFALPPDSRDSALLVTLPPGAYSAHIENRSEADGVALLEIYVLPGQD